MKKATHTGHCQVCGSEQMLPGGVLSLHGYTKRCGFFSGTCRGAKHLPFEQDISLIKGAIASAKAYATTTRLEADRRENMTDANNVFRLVYISASIGGRRDYGYREVQGRIENRPVKGETQTWDNFYFVFDYRGQSVDDRIHDTGPLEKLVKSHNQEAASHLRELAKKADDYVAWQQGRIKNWKPSPLTPRK